MAAFSRSCSSLELEPDVAAWNEPLELIRCPFGDDSAAIEHCDTVGEAICLLQILRCQEDGHAAGDEVADDVPHHTPASRVEAGGWLVEEDDPRLADQRHRQVETTTHASRVGRNRLVRRVNEVESVEQLVDSALSLALAEMAQLGDQRQVLLAGEKAINRDGLTGHADRVTYRIGFLADIVARNLGGPGVGVDEGRKDEDGCGLTRAVWSKEGEDRSFRNLEIYTVEDNLLAVGLAQTLDANREPGVDCRRHDAPPAPKLRGRGDSDVEVFDRRHVSRERDHVVELRRDLLAELLEGVDDLDR